MAAQPELANGAEPAPVAKAHGARPQEAPLCPKARPVGPRVREGRPVRRGGGPHLTPAQPGWPRGREPLALRALGARQGPDRLAGVLADGVSPGPPGHGLARVRPRAGSAAATGAQGELDGLRLRHRRAGNAEQLPKAVGRQRPSGARQAVETVAGVVGVRQRRRGARSCGGRSLRRQPPHDAAEELPRGSRRGELRRCASTEPLRERGGGAVAAPAAPQQRPWIRRQGGGIVVAGKGRGRRRRRRRRQAAAAQQQRLR